jgi:heat shock protein HtpX
MIEQIESNRRRSAALVAGMALVLVALGGTIGGSRFGSGGAAAGALAAAAVWLVLWLVAVLQGDRIMLAAAGARRIEKHDAPRLFNVVEEMTIASGLGRMPEVWLIQDDSPNAFAAGRRPENRVVAVTTGLLRLLDRDELQGVVAHEMGHHKNGDIRLMILMGVMLGAVVMISELFVRGVLGGHRTRSTRGKGVSHPALAILAILAAILAPVVARILYFSCSRRREYLADASGARFTRYPEGLARALEKISGSYVHRREAEKVLAPMYIVNPLQPLVAAAGLFATHPPTGDRVRILRAMGGAGFKDYNDAFRRVLGGGSGPIGVRALASDRPEGLRAAVAPEAPFREALVRRAKETHALAARVDGLTLLTCSCGVGIKVPAGARWETIPCPRCGRENEIPRAKPAEGERFTYVRKSPDEWESFRCPCGAGLQLHPMFDGRERTCNACGRSVEIRS